MAFDRVQRALIGAKTPFLRFAKVLRSLPFNRLDWKCNHATNHPKYELTLQKEVFIFYDATRFSGQQPFCSDEFIAARSLSGQVIGLVGHRVYDTQVKLDHLGR